MMKKYDINWWEYVFETKYHKQLSYHVTPITYDIVDHCIAFSQLPITHYQPQQR
jgi:hypothetical protein